MHKINTPRGQIPFVINSRDRLSELKKLIYWVTNKNNFPVKIIILDNQSTYTPLLEYYNKIEKEIDNLQIIRLPRNYGSRAISLLKFSGGLGYYIYTDPDVVPKEDCPPNLIQHLLTLARKYPKVNKIGISLEINDIPDKFALKSRVVNHEKSFWKKETHDRDAYIAGVDTTLALYKVGYSSVHIIADNLRTKRPYVARHLTWYYDTNNLPEEFLYYAKHASVEASWTKFLKESGKIKNVPVKQQPVIPNTQQIIQNKTPSVISTTAATGRMANKTFTHKTSNGRNTTITFVNDKICKGWDNVIGDVSIQGRRVTVKWRGRMASTVTMDFNSKLNGYTGISAIHGRVYGKLIDDNQHLHAKPNVTVEPKKPVNVSSTNKLPNQSSVYMVVCAYKINTKTIENFLDWNKKTFISENVHAIIVTDRNINLNYDFATILPYPTKQDIFSIPRTINYGIRSITTNNCIIVKTDIDIIFSIPSIRLLKTKVTNGNGLVSLCSDIDSQNRIKSLNNRWVSLPKDPEAKGACFALTKHDWHLLKGYDERIEGWGGDDNEMWMRASKRLRMSVNSSAPVYHIRHRTRLTSGKNSYFSRNSDKNMTVTKRLDWKSNSWGVPIVTDIQTKKKGKLKLVLAITTLNRMNYLQQCIKTFNSTKTKNADWTLIIADDGSTDGTIDYLNSLTMSDVNIKIIKNNHRGIHHQTNTIIKELESFEFDVCFKCDDDVYFVRPGWDLLYYKEIYRTGYDHLNLYQPEWRPPIHQKMIKGLMSMATVEKSQGCFFTLTKEIIRKVGFVDTQQFGYTGLGHIDYLARCCRAGFNRHDAPLDVKNSQLYIKLQKGKNYKPAISMDIRNKENNQKTLNKKLSLIRNPKRMYIPYGEIPGRA